MLKTLRHADGSTRLVHLSGWKRQAPDARDAAYGLRLTGGIVAAPPSWDNRNICSPIEDQGELGSCTANMLAALVEANEGKRVGYTHLHLAAALAKVGVSGIHTSADGVTSFTITVTPPPAPAPVPPTPPAPTPAPTPAPPVPPAPQRLIRVSRLFEYYATRTIEGTVSQDSGASIRDAIKAAAQYGVLDESVWPYDISKFAVKPTAAMFAQAATHKITSYHAINDGDIATMKSALALGQLVGFGFDVYDYMMSDNMASEGLLCRPTASEALQGGHAVALVGYDDNKVMPDGSKGAFLVRNSWGTGWGWQGTGYFWMAYNYVSDPKLASDFWVVVSSPI